MPFKNELISEADKARFDWNRFKWNPYRPGLMPWKWTIDRERDAFLVMLVARGREDEHPEMYAFWWRGEVIKFSAEIRSKGTLSTGLDLLWKVFDMEMKTSLFAEKDEVEKLLREAIDAFGTVYERAGVKSVNVVFVPQSPRKIVDDSRPGQEELTYQQRRTMRYETSGLIDSYELPKKRRVILPIVGGIAMIAVFVFWIYINVKGELKLGDFMRAHYQRGRGPLLVLFWWAFFSSMLIGGLYCLRLAFRNAKERLGLSG